MSVSTAKIAPPKITSISLQLLRGTGSDAKIMRRCGTLLSRACKVHRNEGLSAVGGFNPRIDKLPMVIKIEKRVRRADGSGWKWSTKRGVVFESSEGTYKASIKRALAVQGTGQFRIRTKVEFSWRAQSTISKYVYINLLPDLA
jgi:hypothetical protein